MKTAKLIAMSTLIMAAQTFAKGPEYQAYHVECHLGTRTKAAETVMNFVPHTDMLSYQHEVLSDIFAPVLPEPFSIYMHDAVAGNDAEVKVTDTEDAFLVDAYEILYAPNKAPELVKEFQLEAKKFGSGFLVVKKLLIDGVDHSDDVSTCDLSVTSIGG